MNRNYSKFRFKTVSVRAYWRFRYGKWEYVKHHFRKPPQRHSYVLQRA